MKFRIKVEEKVNGVKEYTPQVRFNWWDLWWENILIDDRYGEGYGYCDTAITTRYIYDSEEKAMMAIDKFKTHIREQPKKEVKTIKYIDL